MRRLLLVLLLGTLPASAQPPARRVDPSASTLEWRGTRFNGRGAHEGTLRVHTGWLAFTPDGRLTGAHVEVALASLAISDIPAHEPVPRRRLRAHLLDEDFFWADRHPVATLRTTQVTHRGAGRYRVEALLTLRGVARPIAFDAVLTPVPGGVRGQATLRLHRSAWGMRFGLFPGSDVLVDDPFTLAVTLVAR